MIVKGSGLLMFFLLVTLAVGLNWRHGPRFGDLDIKLNNATDAHPKIDVASLVERLTMPIPLTIEQIMEEQRMEKEQVNTALDWLNSADPKQRIVGAEQLGAYPTAEAEKALADALNKDDDSEVRVAAATSLANFLEPGAAAIRGLLSVLLNPSEDVRDAALGTLDIYLQTLDADSARHRQIITGLRKLAKSPHLDRATRDNLRDLLANR